MTGNVLKGWLGRPKQWARTIKRDVVALWIAARDQRTPVGAKIVAGCVAAYALSPIDLIPDFIPLVGYLDDILIVPAGIMLAVKLIPVPLMQELRVAAAQRQGKPVSKAGLTAIIFMWLAAAIWGVWMLRRAV